MVLCYKLSFFAWTRKREITSCNLFSSVTTKFPLLITQQVARRSLLYFFSRNRKKSTYTKLYTRCNTKHTFISYNLRSNAMRIETCIGKNKESLTFRETFSASIGNSPSESHVAAAETTRSFALYMMRFSLERDELAVEETRKENLVIWATAFFAFSLSLSGALFLKWRYAILDDLLRLGCAILVGLIAVVNRRVLLIVNFRRWVPILVMIFF